MMLRRGILCRWHRVAFGCSSDEDKGEKMDLD
jgi:hypothetical protein